MRREDHRPLLGYDADDNGPATPSCWWAFRAWSNKVLYAADIVQHTPLSERLLRPTARWYARMNTPLPEWSRV